MKSGVLPSFAQYLLVLVFLLASVLIQGRWGHSLIFHHARPDLSIVVVGAAAALLGWRRGAFFGLIGGLLSAALVPVNFGTQIVSFTLGGMVTGWLPALIAGDSPVLAVASGLVCSSVIGLSATIFAPSHHLRTQFIAVVGQVSLNTLLGIPMFYLFKVLKIGAKQQDSLFDS